jgi:hypothetical protein
LGHDGESHRRARWQRGPGHHSQRDDRPQACARDALGSRACTFAPGEQPRHPRVPTMPGPADAPRSPACQTQARFPRINSIPDFSRSVRGTGSPLCQDCDGGGSPQAVPKTQGPLPEQEEGPVMSFQQWQPGQPQRARTTVVPPATGRPVRRGSPRHARPGPVRGAGSGGCTGWCWGEYPCSGRPWPPTGSGAPDSRWEPSRSCPTCHAHRPA